MSHDKVDKSRHIPDSDTKKASGSKSVHSELDDSTEDGFKPKKGDGQDKKDKKK
ncbi:hypothetical protein SAMN03097699_0984 [Flavobacteriaceae bacterium MAR_2010_188]|nr:hypothetical protein SAMN03097699_0984 [Flavobacteriaceae bacterium MAR_2010_188]